MEELNNSTSECELLLKGNLIGVCALHKPFETRFNNTAQKNIFCYQKVCNACVGEMLSVGNIISHAKGL